MSKQTAVEWYENKLIELDIDFGGHKNYWIERKKIRDQAKQMEKEQMKEAHLIADHYPRGYEFDKWYNETYGGKDE
jgi:hypothetical protein